MTLSGLGASILRDLGAVSMTFRDLGAMSMTFRARSYIDISTY